MRKILFIFLAAFVITAVNAQTIVQKRAYRYDTFVVLDSNYEVKDARSLTGIVVFSEAEGTEYISVTTGDEVVFNGPVKQKKQTRDGNETTHVYLFVMEFQGQNVPLQLYEIYDSSVSDVVPTRFMVAIHHKSTGEYVQGHSLERISRIK